MESCLLLSGGLDSIALAYWLKPKHAITINYGQNSAKAEIKAAKEVCNILKIQHYVISVDCSSIGSGDLLNKPLSIAAPESDWWPFRNQLLVTLAGSTAIEIGASEIILGSVRSDGYHSDGTSHFYSLLSALLEFQEGNLKVSAPAIELTALELIEKSSAPIELLSLAHSCHKSDIPCSACRGCYKHSQTMQQLLTDERS